jgi:hypothetical protein
MSFLLYPTSINQIFLLGCQHHSLIFEEMADLKARVQADIDAAADLIDAARIEAARVLIVDEERDKHESAMSKFRPQTRIPRGQDARSHIQDGKYAVFFDNVSTLALLFTNF